MRTWGRIEPPAHLDLYVDPTHPDLTGDVLAWFDQRTTGQPTRTVTVLDTEHHLLHALHHARYRPDRTAPFFQHCTITLDTLPTPRLPDGYQLRPTRPGEAAARATLHRASWHPTRIAHLHHPPLDLDETEPQVTTDSYQTLMDTWPYRHDLDIVVEAPDGTLAASALGWLDSTNRSGELEPVGTHPHHSRRGLATAASLACLHALRHAGATCAVVYPRGDDRYPIPRRLYHALGFHPVAHTVTLTR